MENFKMNRIQLEVIATFDSFPQDMFTTHLADRHLQSEKTIIKYIQKQLDYPKDDLVKLSLCWNCKEEDVLKYKTISDSIYNNNGKYYFNSWAKEQD
tara:strand:- start:393 stop:683 length:291 start_codon:yes stop_codon:yes gene_type:complete